MVTINSVKQQDVLHLPFLYLKLCGVWKPFIISFWLEVAFNLFTVLIIIICKTVILTEILGVLFVRENMYQVLLENIYMIVTMISGFLKMLMIISKRKKITLLTRSCLTKEWNPSRDEEESLIITKYNQLIRYITLSYAIMVGGTIMVRLSVPIVTGTWVLPLYSWHPCNMNLSICFWPCYVHQMIGFLTLAVVHVACEALVIGFMLQLCAQLSVLSYRVSTIHKKMQNLARHEKNKHTLFLFESLISNACIVDHNATLKFAKLLSETFLQVLFIQFCASLSVICTSVYLLTILNLYSINFLMIILYFVCMLNQLLLYCWYSNEVLSNSSTLFQSIYDADWIALHSKTRKTLILMMLVASSPIQLFRGTMINVNLDAYLNILKFSYSAFNILKNQS